MKNKYSVLSLLLGILLLAVSCKEDEKFAKLQTTSSSILFQVADGHLTGSAFAGVVQPEMQIIGARFAKAAGANYNGGNVVITAVVSPNVTGLVVNFLSTNSSGVVRQQRASLTGSGSIVFTHPIATIGLGGATPANNTVVVLEFVATASDGTTTARIFSATIVA